MTISSEIHSGSVRLAGISSLTQMQCCNWYIESDVHKGSSARDYLIGDTFGAMAFKDEI